MGFLGTLDFAFIPFEILLGLAFEFEVGALDVPPTKRAIAENLLRGLRSVRII